MFFLKNLNYFINFCFALILYPFTKINSRKKIILIGGHSGEFFADNSKALFEYLIINPGEYQVYWVINEKSLDKKKVIKSINRGSVKNYLFFLQSEGLFFSHSASDVAPLIHQYIKPNGLKVYIEHGIHGLKKVKYTGRSKDGFKSMADLFISVSEFEKNLKINEFGLKENSIAITGLPRFDKLNKVELKEPDEEKFILFMPTWREWYKDLSKEEFVKTDFYQKVVEVINSKELRDIMEKNNYKLKVYLHFYFHQFIPTLDIVQDRVEIMNIDEDVQKLLIKADILLTDYSSVCWDFFYLKKPVLFYQFDQERYEIERGSYLNLNTELMGEKSKDIEQLIKHMNYTIENYEEAHNKYSNLLNVYFKYNDSRNSKRVMEHFEEARLNKSFLKN